MQFDKCYNCPKTYQKRVKMDIETIKKEYETTRTSYKALGTKYETHYKKIGRVAKKGNWIKYNPKATANAKGTPPPQQPKSTIAIDSDLMMQNIKELLQEHYREVDDIAIELYIYNYLSFKQLQDEVKSEGMFITSEKTSKSYANPKVNMMQMHSNNIMSIGKELGLTVSSRIKLGIKKEEVKKGSIFSWLDSFNSDKPLSKEEQEEVNSLNV